MAALNGFKMHFTQQEQQVPYDKTGRNRPGK